MDRPIIYPGEVPAVDDLLYGWQRSMVALSRLAQAVFGKGGGTWVDGFQVTPGAGLTVTVPPGQIYQLNPVDPNGYGALPDDTSQILQQFLNDSYTSFNVPAPTTSGQSIDYLIQFTPVTEDEGNLVLQYFDVANPNVAFGGPNNSGESQATQRLNTVQVELISGTPSTTGQQVAPALSGSAVAGFVVTVAYGQTSIAQSDITVADGSAPFLTLKLPAAAGIEIANTFTQTQTMQENLVVQGTATVDGGVNSTTGAFSGEVTVAPATQANAALQLSQLFIGNRKVIFTANGTWNIPNYVSTIWVSGCAGGGGGGCGVAAVSGGNGGGAGQSVIKTPISVIGGHSLSISIGAGGSAGAAGNNPGVSGGNTVLTDFTSSTTLLTLSGGAGGGPGGAGSSTQSATNPMGSGYPAGGQGFIISVSSTNNESFGGAGASSLFGSGGAMSAGVGGGASQNGFGYGSGGGGGCANVAGGSGAPGFLIIEW